MLENNLEKHTGLALRRFHGLGCLCLLLVVAAWQTSHAEKIGKSGLQLLRIEVQPAELQLAGGRQRAQLVATGHYQNGTVRDLTHEGQWASETSQVRVSAGRVRPISNGTSEVSFKFDDHVTQVKVVVSAMDHATPVSFRREIVPILSSLGCSDIRCHGAPSGKSGFRLSLWGFDPAFDHDQLIRDADGRRTNAFEPEQSLLLLKPLTRIPHIGGKRMSADSDAAELLREWQRQGLRDDVNAAKLTELSVYPSRRVLNAPARQQQLQVIATFEDGSKDDVTHLASYSTSDLGIAEVDRGGNVQFRRQGEVAIMCRFQGAMASSRLMHIAAKPSSFQWSGTESQSFIDDHVFAKLRQLNISPSQLCTDEVFIRRVYLDLCGVLPQPDEVIGFVTDNRRDKRSQLVDHLLQRPEFADLWTKKWLDVLRVSRDSIQLQGAQAYQQWLHNEISQDRSLASIVRSLLTSTGASYKQPQSNFFCAAPLPRSVTDPDYFQKDMAEATAQLFLGIRLQCAQCHNHPFERWTQDDYLGLAAFFTQVERSRLGKAGPTGRPDRREISVSLNLKSTELKGEQKVSPHFPGEVAKQIAEGVDRRKVLTDWLVSKKNPYFAKSLANRVWFHLLGQGIVEPVDDFRDSNPSVNDELLEALADYFARHDFRLKPLVRAIVLSSTYQLSATPNGSNRRDTRYFSRRYPKPLLAEVLLDAVCDVTGVPESYQVMKDYIVGIPTEAIKLPHGTRAVQLPVTDIETLINSSGKYVRYELHPFLRTFGQPARTQTCECDRVPVFTRKQALELTVGKLVARKLSGANRLDELLGKSPESILDELYLRALARPPSARAKQSLLEHISSNGSTRQAWEDVLWTILNSKEFIYQH